MTAFVAGVFVGIALTWGGWWLVVWCATADMDDAGWTRGRDE